MYFLCSVLCWGEFFKSCSQNCKHNFELMFYCFQWYQCVNLMNKFKLNLWAILKNKDKPTKLCLTAAFFFQVTCCHWKQRQFLFTFTHNQILLFLDGRKTQWVPYRKWTHPEQPPLVTMLRKTHRPHTHKRRQWEISWPSEVRNSTIFCSDLGHADFAIIQQTQTHR